MSFRTAALQHINDARNAAGLAPLQHAGTLAHVAEDGDFVAGGGQVVHGRAFDMGERNYFSHAIKGSGNQGVSHMLVAAGIVHSGFGENVGFVSATDDEDVAASNIHGQLMAHPPHAANILNPAFTHVGIGMWRSAPGVSWLGAPPPALPNSPLTRVFITAQVFATNPVPAGIPGAGASYHSVTPVRILDTRTALGVPVAGPLGPQARLDLLVAGTAGLPASSVSGVLLNVAVTGPTAGSFLTVFPAGELRPLASNLNFTPGLTVANLVAVKVGAGGQVSIFNAAGSTHVVVDVAGWFDGGGAGTGSRYHAIAPNRLLDTRPALGGAGAVGPGGTLDLPIVSLAGLPPTGVSAVVVNLTVTEPTAAGFLTVFPTGESRPLASNLNFGAGRTVANLVVAKVGAGGAISVFNSAGLTQLVADVAGWFDDGTSAGGARYTPLTPARVLDTRLGLGAPAAPLGAGATLDLQVTGTGGVPAVGVGAVVVNVTVAGPTAPSFLAVFPAGGPRPNTANLNFVAGQVVPNLVVAKVGAGGRVSIFNPAGSTHVIADVAGWFGV